MARMTEEQWELLEADYHTGIYSKNQLAEKYDISHTAVNKRLKNIEPKFQELVSTQIAIKSELAEESFKQVSAIETAVDEVLRNKNLIFGLTNQALKGVNELLAKKKAQKVVVEGQGKGYSTANVVEYDLQLEDYEKAINAIDKASVTLGVNPRHANQQINVQTNTQVNNQIKTLDDFYE